MPAAPSLHPTADQLDAFAQGRLPPDAMADVESHVATCDTCCQHLHKVPEDTLVQLAREAATFGFRQEDTLQSPAKSPPPGIPPELRDHPRYRVLGLVGMGGMGAVYKAEHRLMERLVALKVISPSFLKNVAAVERFHREFKSAARLAHPNVVTAFDAEREGDLHFLVMEFVEGLSLDRLVHQAGRLPVARACHLIHQAALGLQHAHERGMVHRDIKPQNLMVGRKGQVKVLDFGLARLATDDDTSATAEGMILGTPDYIAPEQAANARAADVRSDIYSLGCTLYFALTGQPPFPKGSFFEKLTLHSTKEPEPIRSLRPDVPPELAQVLDRMIAKDPRRRYQTPSEVAKDLAPFAREKATEKASEPRRWKAAEPASGRREPPEEQPSPVIPLPEPAPLLDPLANLALAAATPLRPVIKPGRAGFSTNPPQLVAILAACGVALALLILAFPLANWLMPGPVATNGSEQREPSKTNVAGKAARPANPPPTPPAIKPTIATPPLASQGDSQATTQPLRPAPTPIGTATGSREYRALFVIPTTDLYGPDYYNTQRALIESNIKMQIAALTDNPSTLKNNPGALGPPRDVPYGDKLRASDYDFIIFTGFDTHEFAPGGDAAETTRRLIEEFKKEGKLVTAICRGQQVLAEHGELKGKKVAWCEYVDAYDATQPRGGNVEAAGQIVTASGADDARAFVAKIVGVLDAR